MHRGRSSIVNCFILHVLLATNSFRPTTCRCNSFKTVTISVRSVNDEIFTTNVTGCIQRASLRHLKVNVEEAYVANQMLPRLSAGSVQNLARLQLITFKNCSTQTIEPRAFRNVPRLEGVALLDGFLKTVPKGVFQRLPSLSIIRLDNNEINRIEDGAFANVSALNKLTLSENQLEEWNAGWFENNEELAMLDFENNLMRKIPADAFPNMPNLTTIWFDRNEIASIEPNAFRGLDRLVDLGLSFNHLTVVDPEAFPNNFRVDNLYLTANKLSYLEPKLLDRVRIEDAYLVGNPWQCSCLTALAKLLDFYKTNIRAPKFCVDDNVPICINDEEEPCVKMTNGNLTLSYLDLVRQAIATQNKPEMNECYRFD